MTRTNLNVVNMRWLMREEDILWLCGYRMLGQKKADDVGSNVTVAAIYYWKKIKKNKCKLFKNQIEKNLSRL